MRRIEEIRPDIEDGIDRKVLSHLRARFLKVNHGRMLRAMQALSNRQQQVLRLLPLLFHVNHPLLPGYVSGQTPAGVSNFEPDNETLAEAQRFSRAFVYKPYRKHHPLPIHGLFLMGSLGTVAQAEQSDMDLWLCHDRGLNEQQLHELRKKCDLLENWAATMGAEAHIFLIDPQRFVQGIRENHLTSDDCGTTQHYLLLDEFYRTTIWMCGRTPLWWMVPAYEEHRYEEYSQILLAKRFIRAEDVLDLGHLAHIPTEEFIAAGMWQLCKGIESPYKSVLKLMLTEVYAREQPHIDCLSLRFKRAVYANQLDIDELDPYVVIYRRLEEYLKARGENERLELVRRCLYLKVDKKLSRLSRQSNPSWQRHLLERLTAEWGWDQRQLALLDSRSQWKLRQVSSERRLLVNELNYSYRFLSQFARSKQLHNSNTRDLGIMGRRLYAAFERKSGKIEFINPGIAPDLAEDTLTLAQVTAPDNPNEFIWALFSGSLGTRDLENFAPLRRSRELIELLTWSHRNGVIDASTRLSLHPGNSDLTEHELLNLLLSLQQSIPLPLPVAEEDALLRPSQPEHTLLLVNVGIDPLKQFSQMNIHMTTERTDALNYSGVRENLVLTLDQVTLNSWNEVHVSRYTGPNALLECLRDYLNTLPNGDTLPSLSVRSFCRNRATAIADRVDELFNDVLRHYLLEQPSRYLLQIKQQYHLLHLKPGLVSHSVIKDLTSLNDHLNEPQAQYSEVKLDRGSLEGEDLALILPAGLPRCIQVFYRLSEDGSQAELSVLDEHNSLWRQKLPYRDELTLLTPLQRFLHSLLYRRNAMLTLDHTRKEQQLEVRYYRILPDGTQRALRLEPRPVPASPVSHPFYDVQAIVEAVAGKPAHVTLYCNHREFSELEYTTGLFGAVAQHILSQRRDHARYPCYITDLDLSALYGEGPIQSIHYLRYKSRLEAALNQALNNA